MTEREALKLALAALKQIDEAMPFPVAKLAIMEAEKALAQPEQEPCRHRIADIRNGAVKSGYMCMDCGALFGAYTAPPHRKPLSDEQWQVIADTLDCLITRKQKDAIDAVIGIKE